VSRFKEVSKKLFDPFPYTRGFFTEMSAALRLCVVIAFLFYWVEPFGIQCASTTHLMIFGIIAFLSALMNWSLAHFVFSQFIDTEKWTVFKDIIRSLIFLIVNALTLLWYAHFIGNNFDTSLAVKFVFYAFLIAIVPFFYRNLSINNMLLEKRLEEVQKLNQLINKKKIEDNGSIPFVIKSNIVNEVLETNNKELLYIQAEKNYINVFLNKNEKDEHILLRISLINTLQQLNDPYIIQSHRSYLVNLRHVIKVTGSSQGLKLILNNTTKIPISKTYKREVMKKIADFESQKS